MAALFGTALDACGFASDASRSSCCAVAAHLAVFGQCSFWKSVLKELPLKAGDGKVSQVKNKSLCPTLAVFVATQPSSSIGHYAVMSSTQPISLKNCMEPPCNPHVPSGSVSSVFPAKKLRA